ncbi:malonate decarboxylase holo-[acyl-carrier-protein] synthase [Sphingomonas sp. PAMC26645]|uniref:malonate decarboxylase holo-[acyl-carrier-protein] synthase n=1 Tax=Sphingomonas sp. PAMC26645 TaxID=2565555 RepID=UPI001B34D37A|nr:malonate decarboxylase holo-[acyl-carrier-protein] synthase [Sphingomonas sp. PAMC26645]
MVRVDQRAWATMLRGRPELAAELVVADWVSNGSPLVVRRPDCAAQDGMIALGLPLPPSHGKRRIAVELSLAALIDLSSPPTLAEAQVVAPKNWHPTIARLLDVDPAVRTFGGLAWQFLTGLPYLSPSSDLDLLWLQGAPLGELAAIDADAPMRIDGEVVASDGGAVQWRELGSATGEVLVKRLHGASTMSVEAFMALT